MFIACLFYIYLCFIAKLVTFRLETLLAWGEMECNPFVTLLYNAIAMFDIGFTQPLPTFIVIVRDS